MVCGSALGQQHDIHNLWFVFVFASLTKGFRIQSIQSINYLVEAPPPAQVRPRMTRGPVAGAPPPSPPP